jgi:methylmalonyl-CoA/ethylmalonyl-CoA epimerase
MPPSGGKRAMPEKLKTSCVDHVSIAVKNLKNAEEDLKRVFGREPDGRYKDRDENISVAYFMVGPTAVEIMEDLDGTGEVAKFIEKHGEGVMVLSFRVGSVTESLDVLSGNGALLLDRKPRYAKELKRRFAFLHPKQFHGVLAEIIDGEY